MDNRPQRPEQWVRDERAQDFQPEDQPAVSAEEAEDFQPENLLSIRDRLLSGEFEVEFERELPEYGGEA